MLHSFDVVIDDPLIHTQEFEKIGQQLMALGDFARQSFAGSGQDKTAILLVFQKPSRIEPLNHVGYAGLGDVESGSDIHHAGIPFAVNQFENSLEVILDRGGASQSGRSSFWHAPMIE